MASPTLTTGDYLILAFLKNGPRSPYDLKKEMTSSVNFFWHAQHSQVYQQAARLLRGGFVEPRGAASNRGRQLLGLTAVGTAAVDDWLEQPASSYRVYDESLAKVYFASLATPEATARLLEDQRDRHRVLLSEFEALHRVLAGVDFGSVVPGQRYALELGMEVERAYLRWAEGCLADLAAQHPDAT